MKHSKKYFFIKGIIVSFVLLQGCLKAPKDKRDPLEGLNRGIYQVNKTADVLIIKPVALIYDALTPYPLRTSVNNFFQNVGELPTIANGILQAKFKQVGNDTTRFVINSTLGFAGIFDVDSSMGFEKQQEDFGLTLAKFGYKDSIYIVLPLLGPSTLRDTVGRVGTYYMSPWPYIESVKGRNELTVLTTINTRRNLLDAEKVMQAAATDEYTYLRDVYLQRRNYLIQDTTAGAKDDPLAISPLGSEEAVELDAPPE
ncbi:MAG: Lipoprotein [Francisellaceae bacterium]|nr:Lipoprotein [Francisellaceae bacterium]